VARPNNDTLYYYLLILKAAYLLEPQSEQPPLHLSPPTTILTGVLVFAMLWSAYFPPISWISPGGSRGVDVKAEI